MFKKEKGDLHFIWPLWLITPSLYINNQYIYIYIYKTTTTYKSKAYNIAYLHKKNKKTASSKADNLKENETCRHLSPSSCQGLLGVGLHV